MSNENQGKTKLTVNGILADLENGLTRTKESKNYNPEKGCIADKYNLSDFDIKQLFQHEDLKGKKTRVNKTKTVSFVIVSDEEMESDEVQESSENETVVEVTPVIPVEETATVENADQDAW